MNDFAVFILTHRRADKVITVKTLRRQGYTGKIYLIIDNEDEMAEQYYDNFGKENVVMFDKKAIADKTDEGDNFDDRRTITHARNASFEIAKKLKVKYFIQLDDDYTGFEFRIYEKSNPRRIKNLDNIFKALLKFYKKIPVLTIAMAQGGDFIGGRNSGSANEGLKRKAMNSFICSTDRPFKFIGRMNEDVNTYVRLGGIGKLFLTILGVCLVQTETQSSSGGITEMYKDYGTYTKAFYTVMFNPSCVRVALMGDKHQRLHHRIAWKNAVPKIISSR